MSGFGIKHCMLNVIVDSIVLVIFFDHNISHPLYFYFKFIFNGMMGIFVFGKTALLRTLHMIDICVSVPSSISVITCNNSSCRFFYVLLFAERSIMKYQFQTEIPN